MRIITIFLFVSLISCSETVNENPLIENVFFLSQVEIVQKLRIIENLNTNIYHGKSDSLIQKIDRILDIRRNAGISLGGEFSNINFRKLIPYLDSVEIQAHLFYNELDKEEFLTIISNAKKMLKASIGANVSNDEILKIIISINIIDKLLLLAVRGTFSDGHELLGFNFSSHQNVTPQIGIPYKMFISPDFALPKRWNVSIDSISFLFNDQKVVEPYHLEILGSVVYFEFIPSRKGNYELKGLYTAGIEKEFFEKTEHFHMNFEVK